MPAIEICLSPRLADLFIFDNKTAVIIDVLRATSCFVAGLDNGIKSIRTVSSIEECRKWKEKGYIGAAERGGKRVEGFELGNSPFEYLDNSLKGKNIVATTTNGTQAVEKSIAAYEIILASFLNISSVVQYILESGRNTVVICAGWENQINVEDTLCSGALTHMLHDNYSLSNDASILSRNLYLKARDNIEDIILIGDHARRLLNLGLRKDINYCLQWDVFNVVPILKNNEFIVSK